MRPAWHVLKMLSLKSCLRLLPNAVQLNWRVPLHACGSAQYEDLRRSKLHTCPCKWVFLATICDMRTSRTTIWRGMRGGADCTGGEWFSYVWH